MKAISIIVIFFIALLLSAQTGYILERCSFNAAGGFQSGNIYSSITSIGEKVQGKTANTNYTSYLGFLFPQLDIRLPKLVAVSDVPHDQGLKVQVIWDKCGFDDVYTNNTFYSLWRLDENFNATLSNNIFLKKGALKKGSKNSIGTLSAENQKKIFQNPYVVVEKSKENPNNIYYWQRDDNIWAFVAEIPAICDSEYSYIASTLADSSSANTNNSTFKILYHDLYQYYESLPDSGYSVDNIPPDATANVNIAKNNNSVKIYWDKVEYGTYQGNKYSELNGIWYKIYASNSPNFICDSSTYLATVTNLEYNFPVSLNSKKFFKVVVSDK